MAFSSNVFLFIFLPLTLLGYYLIRQNFRNAFLLVVSIGFFIWSGTKAVLVLIGVIFLSYLGALIIGASSGIVIRKVLLTITVLIDLGVLVYFKYTNFVIDTINGISGNNIPFINIILPVGLSFFVFQSISYLIDVYRKKTEPSRNLIEVALYFALFAKITQGPIVRYNEMKEQLGSRTVNVEGFSVGVQRFIIGLTKKVLIADQLGAVADSIFSIGISELSTPLAWGGIIAYTLQIYFDFSGYSDMAIGLGHMFGFVFPENFNYPYSATSLTDFWRRWHISLSSWFKDYLYIPLGGNRRGNQYVNLIIVWAATGIWHGAAWTFVAWGLFHGILLIVEKLLNKKDILKKLPKPVTWLLTMLIVMIGWVFFRANSLPHAFGYISALFGANGGAVAQYALSWFYDPKVICITVLGLVAMLPWKKLLPKQAAAIEGTYFSLAIRTLALAAMLVISIILVMTSTYTAFIYFQF